MLDFSSNDKNFSKIDNTRKFIEKSKLLYPDQFDYSETIYIKAKSRVKSYPHFYMSNENVRPFRDPRLILQKHFFQFPLR